MHCRKYSAQGRLGANKLLTLTLQEEYINASELGNFSRSTPVTLQSVLIRLHIRITLIARISAMSVLVGILISLVLVKPVAAENLERAQKRAELIEKLEQSHQASQIEKYGEIRRLYLNKRKLNYAQRVYYDSVIEKIRLSASVMVPKILVDNEGASSVIFTIELNGNGGLIKANLNNKSDNEKVNMLSIAILEGGQPYPKFEGSFGESIRTLVITESMSFNMKNAKGD